MDEFIIEDNRHLEDLVKEWKDLLKLQPWTITAEIVRYWDFGITGRVGYISWTVANRTAHMKILDANDYPPDTIVPNDMEVAVVHELLHIQFHFVEFAPDSTEGILFEQSIEATAQALVAAKRAGLNPGGLVMDVNDRIDKLDGSLGRAWDLGKGMVRAVMSEKADELQAEAKADYPVEGEPTEEPNYCFQCDNEFKATKAAVNACNNCHGGSNYTASKEG